MPDKTAPQADAWAKGDAPERYLYRAVYMRNEQQLSFGLERGDDMAVRKIIESVLGSSHRYSHAYMQTRVAGRTNWTTYLIAERVGRDVLFRKAD